MIRPEDRLIQQIRETSQYATWRSAVLKRFYPDGRVPKHIQVHHKTRVKDIIRKHSITTIQEALNCDDLWNVDNGVAITRGEHFIISQLERHKHASPAFSALLMDHARRLAN